MKGILSLITIVSACLLLSSASFAQRDSARMKMREQLDDLMKEKLVEKVGLTESAANRFMSELDNNRKEMRDLMNEKRELMDDIDLDPGAADIESKLDRALDIDIQIAELKKSFKNRLREFMTPQEIAKTMKFRRKFERDLRQEIRKKRGDTDGFKGQFGPDGPRDGKGPGGPPFDRDDFPPPPPED